MMKLLDVVRRQPIPNPWEEGEKIPWSEPGFSQRMLQEHLSQDHDAASRRFEVIAQHVDWIHRQVLLETPSRILDLGCGPGLYASRLVRLGHDCVGIDFSPASIAYAKAQAEQNGLRCTYVEQDVRTADYGAGYGLVMFIFGEFNVFTPADARVILRKAHHALVDGGVLLLEPHTFSGMRRVGESSPQWYSADRGLFSNQPHIYLEESFWDDDDQVATRRYYIVDAQTGDVTRYAQSMQAYTDEGYQDLLHECGFDAVAFHASLREGAGEPHDYLYAITARKQRAI